MGAGVKKSWIILVLLSCTTALGQEPIDMESLVTGVNDTVQVDRDGKLTGVSGMIAYPPQWGVAVKTIDGQTIDLFGQVPYEITETGAIVRQALRCKVQRVGRKGGMGRAIVWQLAGTDAPIGVRSL